MGTTEYLVFALTFVNFILIAYRFQLEEDDIVNQLISNLWVFGLIFLILYIPVSTIIGYWHRKTQLTVENTLKQIESPFFCKMFRVLLDAKTGKASKEDIEEFRKILLDIEKK
jgi:hypothetical protein